MTKKKNLILDYSLKIFTSAAAPKYFQISKTMASNLVRFVDIIFKSDQALVNTGEYMNM